MANNGRKPVKPVVKPYLTGNPTDERTIPGALGFFGVFLMALVMTFLVSSVMTMDNSVLRIALCAVVELLVLFIFYNNAVGRGTEAVARGEILYQRQEKGLPFSESEQAICFHPAKGFVTAMLGSIPILICAVLLAVTARRQTTSIGTLPGWMSVYQRRSEIGDALVAYTASTGLGLEDILRMIVRIAIMPFVSMVGAENRDGMLLLERLSPVLLLLPALAYGTGYLRGRGERTRIHTGIAESNRKRVRKEKKARKMRAARGPEQLN